MANRYKVLDSPRHWLELAAASGAPKGILSGFLAHVHNWKRSAIGQRNAYVFHRLISLDTEKLRAGERGAHFEAHEAGRFSGILAGGKKQGADAAARPVRTNEEGANLCGIAARVEQIIVAVGPLVGAVQSLAFAPAAAAYDDRLGLR